MLRDFLQLEEFYGAPFAVQPFEDLLARYDAGSIRSAIRRGMLRMRLMPCGRRRGGGMLYLTEAGRRAARASSRLH